MRNKKTILILTILLMVICILTPVTLATVIGGQPLSVDTSRIPVGVTDRANSVIGVIQVIGIIIAVIIIMILGIKYMIGSVDEKAEIKQSILPYLVGAICVLACTTIVNVTIKFVGDGNIANSGLLLIQHDKDISEITVVPSPRRINLNTSDVDKYSIYTNKEKFIEYADQNFKMYAIWNDGENAGNFRVYARDLGEPVISFDKETDPHKAVLTGLFVYKTADDREISVYVETLLIH